MVFVRGFQLNMDDDIMCMFDDQTTEGLYVTENDASCILPMVHRTGSIPFVVRVRRASGSIEIYTSTFHIGEFQNHASLSDSVCRTLESWSCSKVK